MKTVQFTCDRCKHKVKVEDLNPGYKEFSVDIRIGSEEISLCESCVISCHEWFVSGK